jgi:hypothetical protein
LLRGFESTCAIAQQDGDGIAVMRGYRNVNVAVSIEVARRQQVHWVAGSEWRSGRSPKTATTVTQQDTYRPIAGICGKQVGRPVAVDIRRNDRVRSVSNFERGPGSRRNTSLLLNGGRGGGRNQEERSGECG